MSLVSELPSVYLMTRENQAFTIPYEGDINKPCVMIFRTVELAAGMKRLLHPLTKDNQPRDLGAESVAFLRKLWLWDVDYYCVIDSLQFSSMVPVRRLSELFVERPGS